MHPSPLRSSTHLRLVSWNIRQGGGNRAPALCKQLDTLAPDVCVLLEYCNSPASRQIRDHLRCQGLTHAVETVGDGDPGNRYGLLIASRYPITVLDRPIAVADLRWRLVSIAAPAPFVLGCVHVPNRGENGAEKYACLESLTALACGWPYAPGLIVGDYNTGRPIIDEQAAYFNRYEERFMNQLHDAGWADAFRHSYPDDRRFSWWYVRNGRRTGFRLDHAFVSPACLSRLVSCDLVHTSERWPSDHAALVIDMHQ